MGDDLDVTVLDHVEEFFCVALQGITSSDVTVETRTKKLQVLGTEFKDVDGVDSAGLLWLV